MFYKFPSTPYVENKGDFVRNDKILCPCEIETLFSKPITIEEKIDGANLGISFDDAGGLLLQNRGSYLTPPLTGQWSPLNDWIARHEDIIFDHIADTKILFGEWCYAKHSVYYNALPDWFIGFDIYDKKAEKFLSVKERNKLMKKMNIVIVPLLGDGVFAPEDMERFFTVSKFGDENCEGVYLRQDEELFLKYRAKMVRKEFRQAIDKHWSRKELQKNRLLTLIV